MDATIRWVRGVCAAAAAAICGCAAPPAAGRANLLTGGYTTTLVSTLDAAYEESTRAAEDLGFFVGYRTADALRGSISAVTAHRVELSIRLDRLEPPAPGLGPRTRVSVSAGPLHRDVAQALLGRIVERVEPRPAPADLAGRM